jgi:hypothetical protein
LIGHFSPIVPPFADRGLSRHLTWSASGDERGNQSGVSKINLGRLQYIRRCTAGPYKKKKKVKILFSGYMFTSSEIASFLLKFIPMEKLALN